MPFVTTHERCESDHEALFTRTGQQIVAAMGR
jgi:hypothetical protein